MEDFKNLTEVRETIDKFDNEIIKLIAKRSICVKAASKFKKTEEKVKAPDRVERIIGKVRDLAVKDSLSPDIAEKIYRTMIGEFINYELNEFKNKRSEG